MPLVTPRLIRLIIWSVAGLLALAFVAEAHSVLIGRNFHTLIPGKVYRCAQPSAADLKRAVARYGVKTVINLRGTADGFEWYDEESRATAELDLNQEDVSFSAGRLPSPHEIRRLVEALDRAEYPIILHCKRGVDRTGLACAVVQLLQTDAKPSEARGQLSLRYGHVPLGRTAAMLRFFDLYDDWRLATANPHSRQAFREFLTKGYCPGPGAAKIEVIEPPKVVADQVGHLRVRVTNQSVEPWEMHPGTGTGIYLRYYVRDDQEKDWQIGKAGLFEATVAPGQSVDLTIVLKPLPSGRYRLTADMVEVGDILFAQQGSEPLVMELIIP
jgi:protein tyrosine phosphatase (PTP) superfamily phosphohydrolase (DUF442 family)